MINNMKDAPEFELSLKDGSIGTSDLMEVFYSQAFKNDIVSKNNGKTCFDVYAEYDPTVT